MAVAFIETKRVLGTDADCVVELAVADQDCGVIHHAYYDPGFPIPPESTAIHGVTDLLVQGRPHFLDQAPELRGLLSGYDMWVAWDAPSQRRFLAPCLPSGIEERCAYYGGWRKRFGPARLSDACRKAGIPYGGGTAADDVQALAALCEWMAFRPAADEWFEDEVAISGDADLEAACARLLDLHQTISLWEREAEAIKRAIRTLAGGDRMEREGDGWKLTVAAQAKPKDKRVIEVDAKVWDSLPDGAKAAVAAAVMDRIEATKPRAPSVTITPLAGDLR